MARGIMRIWWGRSTQRWLRLETCQEAWYDRRESQRFSHFPSALKGKCERACTFGSKTARFLKVSFAFHSLEKAQYLALRPVAVVTVRRGDEGTVATVGALHIADTRVGLDLRQRFRLNADEGVVGRMEDERGHGNSVDDVGGCGARVIVVGVAEPGKRRGDLIVKQTHARCPICRGGVEAQDAEAAQRICKALRGGGIEVWFDQSELRGGDAWDSQIRKRIHDCALFIPIISAHSQARLEGYFRREWKMAADRTHDMAEEKTFLVPVVIDDTSERTASVPDKFREMQWTHLLAGETPPTFVERVSRLLSPETAHVPAEAISAAAAASHAGAAPRPPAPSAPASRQTPRVLLLIAAVVVIGLGSLAVDKFVLSKRPAAGVQGSALSGQSTAPAEGAIPEKSIAVLPFVNMSSDKEQEYFSDGLSEEMIDLLGQVQDLRVPARTSSFSFKGKSDDIRTIAQKLRVAHVLEGSVRKAGNTIRVTVQLIRADSGYHLWSKTYDRDIKDIFKVQDEIAAAVVEVLKVKLGPTQPVASHRSSNTEAYNQYLLGRQFHNRANLDGWRRAIEAFHKAIALDPHYAATYASLAISEASLADQNGDAAGMRQAEADAEKAIALGPEEADGYAARGSLRSTFSWDWTGAQADLAKALILDPTSVAAQRYYASLLESLGRLPDAIAALKKAVELDPLSNSAWERLGLYLTESRDYPAAGQALHRALEIQPESPFSLSDLAALQLLEGKAAEALATARENDFESLRLQGIAMAEHTLGRAKESQQALDELVAKHARDSAFEIAEAFAWRGDKDKALEWLERAYRQLDGGLADVKADLLLDSLHGDPSFKALLRKMKLPE